MHILKNAFCSSLKVQNSVIRKCLSTFLHSVKQNRDEKCVLKYLWIIVADMRSREFSVAKKSRQFYHILKIVTSSV